MTLCREIHFPKEKGDFSLYFMASLTAEQAAKVPDPKSAEASEFVKNLWQPVLELTHNHGTESDPEFSYHNGNTEPQGFGHIGFMSDNLNEHCKEMLDAGVKFAKKPTDGLMKTIAFALD